MWRSLAALDLACAGEIWINTPSTYFPRVGRELSTPCALPCGDVADENTILQKKMKPKEFFAIMHTHQPK